MHEYARVVQPGAHAIGLEDDPPGGREAPAQHPEKRQRRLDAMQDTDAQDDVERLPKPLDIERVQTAVVDPRAQQLGDRPKPGAGLEVDPGPPAKS
jgi:hypothetical protein